MDYTAFQALSPCTLADVLTREQVMDIGIRPLVIRPLRQGMPRVAGPAYTVRCDAGDNLMLHAAIYRAPPGSVTVVQAGNVDAVDVNAVDLNYAVAGGNVCATAQERGVAAFVIDGVIRDLAEIRAMRFPVFARGVIPIPGSKTKLGTLGAPVRCGGVRVAAHDSVVADEEGVVVIPASQAERVLEQAQARAAKDEAETLEAWQSAHRARIEQALRDGGLAKETHKSLSRAQRFSCERPRATPEFSRSGRVLPRAARAAAPGRGAPPASLPCGSPRPAVSGAGS